MTRRSMNLRSHLSAAALVALVVVPANRGVAQAAALSADAPMPFVERIQPADFSAVEADLPGPLAKGASIAIICTEQGHPAYALTVTRNPEMDFEVAFLTLAPEQGTPASQAPVRAVAPLDAPSATRLEQALAIKLARNVFVSDATRKAKDYDQAWWILQRTGPDQVQAAVITGDRADANPDAQAFLDAFVRGLQRYATCDPDDRSKVLYDIDRYTIKTTLTEKSRR